ncbi:hypothetical protein RIF29_21634 [Crotalaria pallida]|uniref:Uncharacterized protein n=1 Tax=Crotalaria pallida TaxID=3830 RepID=A0AAN9F536_CROPI
MVALVMKDLGFGSVLLLGLKFETYCLNQTLLVMGIQNKKLWLQLGTPQVPGGIGAPVYACPFLMQSDRIHSAKSGKQKLPEQSK